MSWAISLTKKHIRIVKDEIEVGYYTYNVSPMYTKAMDIPGLTDGLDGKKCCKMIKTLEKGIKNMEENPKDYKKLNPKNGWGDYEGALKFLKDILIACKKYPKYKIEVN